MTDIEGLPEHIVRQVNEVLYCLRGWLRVRDGDSRSQYNLGLNDLRIAEASLEHIQQDLALDFRDLKLRLTMGGVAVPAFCLSRDAYDFEHIRPARDDLEPGSTLDIKYFFRAPRQYLKGDNPFLTTINLLYAGSAVAHVGSESIGKTLAEGGKLEIVPKEDESSTSES